MNKTLDLTTEIHCLKKLKENQMTKIVSFIDSFEDDLNIYVLMELLRG